MNLPQKQKELELWYDWKKGNADALPQLIRSFDPLIQMHVNKYSSAPIPRAAIEAQGRSLAVKALQEYDPNRGAALNTHIVNHLKHLQRYVIDYQNIGKIPEHRGIAISKFNNVKKNLEENLEREPTIVELSEELNWAPKEVERMLSEQRTDITLRQTGEEGGWWDRDFTETDFTKEIIDFYYHQPTTSMEDRKIIEYYFGMAGEPKLAVKDIALRMNKPESYIRRAAKRIAEEIEQARRQHVV